MSFAPALVLREGDRNKLGDLARTRSWRPRSATSRAGTWVVSLDEKSQIQALDRIAPMLPLPPGLPERRPQTPL